MRIVKANDCALQVIAEQAFLDKSRGSTCEACGLVEKLQHCKETCFPFQSFFYGYQLFSQGE